MATNNGNIKLSIVIPYYKTYELTYKLLMELSIQKTDEVEIFLIDNGCNEVGLDLFTETANIIHLRNDMGVSFARNYGIKLATGKYIAFIDSDDQITMDYIEQLLNLIDTRNEDVIYFNWADFNENTITRHPENYAVWKAIYKKDFVPLFNEEYRQKEDVPFQEEIRRKKHTEYYFDRVLYIYNSNRIGSLWWQTTHKEEIK